MNDRIKDLIALTPLRYNTHQSKAERADELDKFAKMVAKLCADMCSYQALVESEKGSIKSIAAEVALDNIASKMLQKFGVKE